MAVRIISDSGCDIVPELAQKWNVEILPIKTMFGDEEFLDGVTMSHDQFFEKLIESEKMPTTSQVPPFEYEAKYEEIKEAGDTAVCITLSSKLSGCYQSANIALEDYEDCITVVDSNNVCIGQRILVEMAVRLRDEGKSAPEIAEILNREKNNIKLIALLDTLEYLKKGGRISAAVAMAGSLLSIKPVIAIEDGEVVVLGKARGSKNGNNMLKEMVKNAGGIRFSDPICLGYSGLSDALLQKYIEDSKELYDMPKEELPISSIGCAIGTHVGPGAIAVTFFAKQ
ncbi:MAG: DegV family protein [Lachnospiraceae bacterium]|nr:DegV family protein [Lachnospiraceae bacterium]